MPQRSPSKPDVNSDACEFPEFPAASRLVTASLSLFRFIISKENAL